MLKFVMQGIPNLPNARTLPPEREAGTIFENNRHGYAMLRTTWLTLLVATRGNMSAFVTIIPQITQVALIVAVSTVTLPRIESRTHSRMRGLHAIQIKVPRESIGGNSCQGPQTDSLLDQSKRSEREPIVEFKIQWHIIVCEFWTC